jgi:hypothetical protein
MSEAATATTEKPAPAQASPAPAATAAQLEQQANAVSEQRGTSNEPAGPGLRLNTVLSAGQRAAETAQQWAAGKAQEAVRTADAAGQRADRIVNGSEPITQGVVAVANESLAPRPGHTIKNREDGPYMPGASDRLMATAAANNQRAGMPGKDTPGWSNATQTVQQMQANGLVCAQSSSKISGGEVVATACLGDMRAPNFGGKTASVGVSVRF